MKPRALYLLGGPGVGKSTTMAHVKDLLGVRTAPEPVNPTGSGHFVVEPLLTATESREVGVYLGRSRSSFPGTDGLSMSAHPEALKWSRSAGAKPSLVLGEGNRLGTFGFLMSLASWAEVRVGWLTAPQETMDARCQARGSNQSDSWRKGSTTRAAKAAEASGLFVDLVEIDTSTLTAREVAVRLVGGFTPDWDLQ